MRQLGPRPYWLDSGPTALHGLGRRWAMGIAPTQISLAPGGHAEDPFAGWPRRRPGAGGDAPWNPRWVGAIAYEAGAWADRIPMAAADPLGLPVAEWGYYPASIVGSVGSTDMWIVADTAVQATALVDALTEQRKAPAISPPPPLVTGLHPARTIRQYTDGIESVLDLIDAGEIYQANIAVRFDGRFAAPVDPAGLFARLRSDRPNPFAALVPFGDAAVVSASPECFVRWDAEGRISSHPIKGTRARPFGVPLAFADEQLEATRLRDDPKERAEHVMIVDLVRNDLGRVAVPGSVHVPVRWRAEPFVGLWHLVSEVAGQLRADVPTGEALRALYPAGSITGAPKIRACEIIAAIEGERRGVYCGAIGAIEADGSGMLNIPIRTAVIRDEHIVVHAGGGIVADSTPEREYAEILVKAESWRHAVGPVVPGPLAASR